MAIQYQDLIASAVNQVGIPSGLDYLGWLSLIPAIIQKESTFNPRAVSYTGQGLGLMQVNPNIWLPVFNVTREQLFDPAVNITIGSTILRDYINQYGVAGGIGAFFAGPSGRTSTSAKSYVNTVSQYWNSFKNTLARLFNPATSPSGYYYNAIVPTTYDVDSDLVSQYFGGESSWFSAPGSSSSGWTYIMIAAIAVLFFVVIDD